jgi:hypothetical protein
MTFHFLIMSSSLEEFGKPQRVLCVTRNERKVELEIVLRNKSKKSELKWSRGKERERERERERVRENSIIFLYRVL